MSHTLDAFTRAYLEAMFWTDASSDSEDCADATVAELAPESLRKAIIDCQAFQSTNVNKLTSVYGERYDATYAGHDFWLTRNRHGAGFWDRGLGEIGKQLTTEAHAYGSQSLCRGDDGLIHLV